MYSVGHGILLFEGHQVSYFLPIKNNNVAHIYIFKY